MQEITIGGNEAGQRLDKFLAKYMNLAPKSFFYKMMRKKNITLNGKKCEGAEKLTEGDVVKLFLSDETIAGFTEVKVQKIQKVQKKKLDVLYEDDHIVLINKPSGMLSQKAKEGDVSLNEHLIDYLLENGSITEASLRSFRPSICNRLDRNTSGIVACGKSLAGLQMLSEVFRDRSIHKYYQCIVVGEMKEPKTIDGWLVKDAATNTVRILTKAEAERYEKQMGSSVNRGTAAAGRTGKAGSKNGSSGHAKPAADGEFEKPLQIQTKYEPLTTNGRYTLVKVTLLTGRSHQIRAHLASIGHSLVGDPKYGVHAPIEQKYHIHSQLLHSYRLEFPQFEGAFAHLSGKVVEAPLPKEFQKIIDGECLNAGNRINRT